MKLLTPGAPKIFILLVVALAKKAVGFAQKAVGFGRKPPPFVCPTARDKCFTV
jgi:hypothetical protein